MVRKFISLFLLPMLLLYLSGCATGPELIRNNPYDYKVARVFNADFDTVWESIIKALEAHPITTIEKASGILLTDWVQGNSPLYLRKVFVPLAQRETKLAIGILVAQLTPDVLYIVYARQDGPAYAAGIRTGDIILEVNGEKIKNISEFQKVVAMISNNNKVSIRVLRYGINEPLSFVDIQPKKITFDYDYIPVETRYKLNIRATRVDEKNVEVKIINYEEGDFGHYTQFGWQPSYQPIETSTLREKIILDAIELEVKAK